MNKFFIKFLPIMLSVIILLFHTFGYITELYLRNHSVLLIWLATGCIDVIFLFKLGKMTSSLHKSMYTDTLTQLNNRDFFYAHISDEMEKLQKKQSYVSILIIDLDNFKNTNDTYGHIAGDELLKQISNIFKQSTRDKDIVTRWGGDEFIIALPGINAEDALNIANRIRSTIHEYDFFYNKILFKVTISIGIASTRNKMNIDSLIDLADKALYKAKVNKNSVAFLDTYVDL